MLDIYDKMLVFADEHPDLSYCQADERGISLLSSYVAFQLLSGRSLSFDKRGKVDFFQKAYSYGEDILMGILNADADEKSKKAQIELWYADKTIGEQINQIQREVAADVIHKAEQQRQQLHGSDLANRLTNLRFSTEVPVTWHVSYVQPTGVNVHFFSTLGTFISVGALYDPNRKKAICQEQYISIFKALGEESRFTILKAMLYKPMSATELAHIVGVTLPTINHHMKVLCTAGLVSPILSTQNQKGALYQVNRELIELLLEEVRHELS